MESGAWDFVYKYEMIFSGLKFTLLSSHDTSTVHYKFQNRKSDIRVENNNWRASKSRVNLFCFNDVVYNYKLTC